MMAPSITSSMRMSMAKHSTSPVKPVPDARVCCCPPPYPRSSINGPSTGIRRPYRVTRAVVPDQSATQRQAIYDSTAEVMPRVAVILLSLVQDQGFEERNARLRTQVQKHSTCTASQWL